MKLSFSIVASCLLTIMACGSPKPISSVPCLILSHQDWQVFGDAEPPGKPRIILQGEVVLPDKGYEPIFVQGEPEVSGNIEVLVLDLQFRQPVNEPNPKLTANPVNPTTVEVRHEVEGSYRRVRVTCGGQMLWEGNILYGL